MNSVYIRQTPLCDPFLWRNCFQPVSANLFRGFALFLGVLISTCELSTSFSTFLWRINLQKRGIESFVNLQKSLGASSVTYCHIRGFRFSQLCRWGSVLGRDVASLGSPFPTFRNDVVVLSSRFEMPRKNELFWTFLFDLSCLKRWYHCEVSKRRESITQWRDIKYEKNRDLKYRHS